MPKGRNLSKVQKSTKLNICHLADTHLGFRRYHRLTKHGFNQRETDLNLVFREAIDKVIELNPDLVIVAGDLFHSVRPSNAVITFCFRQLRRLTQNTQAQVVLVAGNHESPKRIDSGSILRLFEEIEGVFVADQKLEVFRFGDLETAVTCLPHNLLREGVPENLRADDHYSYNILVAHAQVDQTLRTEFGGVLTEFKSLVPNEWDYIALGHVHRHTVIAANAVYPGSTENTSGNVWADLNSPKGFCQYTLPDHSLLFHQLRSVRTAIQLESIDAKSMNPDDLMAMIERRLKSLVGGIEGKIVRLDVLNVAKSVAQNLDYKALRAWRAKALNLQLDLRIDYTNDAGKITSDKGLTLREEILRYCKDSLDPLRSPEEIKNRLVHYLDLVEGNNEVSFS